MDWITGLPPSYKGDREYNSILTIVDRYTKMAVFLPVQDTMDAAEMAELLYNELECRFGLRQELSTAAIWRASGPH